MFSKQTWISTGLTGGNLMIDASLASAWGLQIGSLFRHTVWMCVLAFALLWGSASVYVTLRHVSTRWGMSGHSSMHTRGGA